MDSPVGKIRSKTTAILSFQSQTASPARSDPVNDTINKITEENEKYVQLHQVFS
jgi:hypothetical protein